jgi:hypothetical protein
MVSADNLFYLEVGCILCFFFLIILKDISIYTHLDYKNNDEVIFY